MAFPFKTGGDFYNCEAQRMRLHNLGANPTETATGLMYFNTGASNLGKHAVVHDGTNFKALAFVDEIATNTAFKELEEKVNLLIGDDVDTDTIIDSWKEVQAFLADIEDTKTLQGMLSSYLPKSGGTMTGTITMSHNKENRTHPIEFNDASWIGYLFQEKEKLYWGHSNTAANAHTLLHSGNIGEYALRFKDEISVVDDNNYAGYGNTADGWPISGPAMVWGLAGYRAFLHGRNGVLRFNSMEKGTLGDWKTIAFTDSTVKAARKLVDAKGNDAVTIDSVGNTVTANSLYVEGATVHTTDGNPVALFGTAYSALGKEDGAIMYAYGLKNLYFYTNGVQRMRINSSGNVTIGGSDLAGTDAKLYVDGVINTTDNINIYGGYLSLRPAAKVYGDIEMTSSRMRIQAMHDGVAFLPISLNSLGGNVLIGTTDDKGAKLQVAGNIVSESITHRASIADNSISYYNKINGGFFLYGGIREGEALSIEIAGNTGSWVGNGITLKQNGNVGIGTTDPKKKLHVVGDLYVDGNIIATKEVSAGGAGQEGASGDGGAEVISQPLAKGQSSYTITNTIKRSDIAVSLYEANVINGQTIWSLCLADIEVTDSQITVTFGSATSVNHKLVAVG